MSKVLCSFIAHSKCWVDQSDFLGGTTCIIEVYLMITMKTWWQLQLLSTAPLHWKEGQCEAGASNCKAASLFDELFPFISLTLHIQTGQTKAIWSRSSTNFTAYCSLVMFFLIFRRFPCDFYTTLIPKKFGHCGKHE